MLSIHHISVARKPLFLMKVSLIFTLTAQKTLSIIQKLVDVVNFTVHTYEMKNKQIYHYLLLKEMLKLHQLSTLFQVNFKVCIKEFPK